MGIGRGRRPRIIATLAIAGVLAMVAVFAPPTAGTVHAADDFLRVAADTTYRVDTGDRLVRVRIDFTMTNLRPNTVRRTSLGTTTTRYYFDRLLFAVPAEARSLVSTSGGSRLGTSVRARDGFRSVTVRFPNLFYRGSRSLRVEFTLPGGKPRSSSDIRVGSAFTTFTTWAWGDAGRSTVRIVLPKGFDEDGYGDDVTQRTLGDRVELTSGRIADPLEWYHVVVADRPSALTDVNFQPGGHKVVIEAWPEDATWRDRVVEVLSDGLPALEEMIGLPWPLTDELTVTEVHTPLLEGYAGFFDPRNDIITMSEDLDDQTILHEASHAWFNGSLLTDRWIGEGLAEHYADRVREQLRLSDDFDPKAVERTVKSAFPLDDWPDPARIDDAETEAQELYGYGAAYTVIRKIAEDIGDDGMRSVLTAVRASENAYAGDDGPEVTGASMDWKQFLDLVQGVGGMETADDLFRDWVVTTSERGLLQTREDARDAYAALEAAGGEWAVPKGARANMALWRFDDATALLDAAEPVLDSRDDLLAASADLALSPPADLEKPFENATKASQLAAIGDTLEDGIAAAAAVDGARDVVEAERSPLVTLGLVGESPESQYGAARTAFEAGDVEAATAASAATVALLAGAESAGTTRALVIGAVVVAIFLLLLVAALIIRRRRHRQLALSTASVGASTTLPATPEPASVGAPEVGPEVAPEVPPTLSQTAPGAEPD